jgi:hypothetical protein
MTKRNIQYWVIPPEADSEFAACMEEVLETYALPYDAAYPVVCMDEQPVQKGRSTRRSHQIRLVRSCGVWSFAIRRSMAVG